MEHKQLTKECRKLTKKLLALEEKQKAQALASTPPRRAHEAGAGNDDSERVSAVMAEVSDKQRETRMAKVSLKRVN